MNNQDITVLFIARRIPAASNGRGNFKFKGDTLYSYDDVIAKFTETGELLVSGDTFSATSSRHQSAIKRVVGGNYTLVPDLTSLVNIKSRDDVDRFMLRRKLAASEYERKIETSRSDNMRTYLRERVRMEKDAARRAIKALPFDQALEVFSGHTDFFRC